MSNSETLQQNNTRIDVNNEELASILITINKLPTVKEEKLQDKVVEPSTTEQTITADEEYTSLGSVTVNAVTNEIDEDITSNNIKEGIEILGVTGTLKEYKEPILQNKEAIPTTSLQNIVADDGYDGLSSVSINAVTNEIDSNIVPENIKNDVEILGVKGSFAGEKFKPRYLGVGNLFSNYNGTELDNEVSMLDTTYLTTLYQMFYNCDNLTHLDLSHWNTSNVTNAGWIFFGCGDLTNLNLNNWNTSNVTNMSYMFRGCEKITNLDLSSFDTSKVTNMSQMFRYCYVLKHLDIRNFTFDKVTNYTDMFSDFPTDCLIIVKSETEKEWILSKFSSLTNIKTVAELGE